MVHMHPQPSRACVVSWNPIQHPNSSELDAPHMYVRDGLMALLKVIILLLAVVQTTRAYDIPPFTWKALEEAEKHVSTAAASLYADSIRFQQAVRERAFTPETPPEQSCRQDIEPITPHSAPSNFVVLGFSLLSTMTAFLLGWYGGVKQAESSQALQQAKVADQAEVDAHELEEAAKLAVTSATNPSITPVEGRQTLSPMPGAQLRNDMSVRADCIAPHEWSSPSGSDKDEDSMQEAPSHQDSNSSQGSMNNPEDILRPVPTLAAGQDQQRPGPAASTPGLDTNGQQGTPQDPSRDMPSTSQHNAPEAHQQPIPHQLPVPPALHTSNSQQSATITPQRPSVQPGTGLKPSSAHSEEAAALNTASTIVDVFAQRLGIDPQQLDQQQKVSLLSSNVAALGVYLNFVNHKENHRLQGISNDQGAQHNEILREGQGDTRAWRQAKEGQKQLQLFFERLADCLLCGLMLMMAGMLYWGTTLGYYQGRLSECSGRRPGYLVNVWKPWHAVESLQTLWCQFVAFADLIVSFGVMLLTVWAVKQHQLLSNSIAQPMTVLVLGLGAAGGTAGWFAVSKVAGDAIVWLSGYWLWIGLHVLCVWFVQDVHKGLTHKAAGGFCKQLFAFAKLPLFYALMGFVFPLTVAACPFWKLIGVRIR